MTYTILTNHSVTTYLLTIPTLQQFFATDKPKDLIANEIGDGNLNLVFIVKHVNEPKRQLIVKQSLPYIRCIGEDYPMAKERILYETNALKKFQQFAPAHTPKIYHADAQMCLVVMQYLEKHIIMRKGMIAATRYPKFADHLSTVLAESLFKTSSLYLETQEKQQLIAMFNTNELRNLTENFVFTYPFMNHPTNFVRDSLQEEATLLRNDIEFKIGVLTLKDLFINKTDALLHGDLHTGSIMINQEDTYIIDPEFAYVGPFGFDVGALLANLVMSWISHFFRSQDNDYQNWILETIKSFITQFEQKFIALWNQHATSAFIQDKFLSAEELKIFQKKFMQNILQESIGFAGCKIARRMLGVAGVEDIRGIKDNASVTRAEDLALNIAREFVVHFRDYQTGNNIIETLNKMSNVYATRNNTYRESITS